MMHGCMLLVGSSYNVREILLGVCGFSLSSPTSIAGLLGVRGVPVEGVLVAAAVRAIYVSKTCASL